MPSGCTRRMHFGNSLGLGMLSLWAFGLCAPFILVDTLALTGLGHKGAKMILQVSTVVVGEEHGLGARQNWTESIGWPHPSRVL